MTRPIGYYALEVVREFASDGDKFAIVLRDDGLVGIIPVFRTKTAARKFYGSKANLLEVWDDGPPNLCSNGD